MVIKSRFFVTVVMAACTALSFGEVPFLRGQETHTAAAGASVLRTVDYMVPHVSTVPANAGKRVHLFVREKVKKQATGALPVVLMIHGATNSAVPVFDVEFENYSWMEYLAKADFDVFAMDHTGYGLSPRPMMDDPCNVAPAQQTQYLRPPLEKNCPAPSPYQLTTIESDWDEINTVVDYLREFRSVEKVTLVAWSRGGPRALGYAVRHPEKIDRMFLYAPRYVASAPSDPPIVLPRPGFPMTVLGAADFYTQWQSEVQCQDQFRPEIRPALTAALLEFDPLGSTWGKDGVRRAPVWNAPPGSLFWGVNSARVGELKMPTLIIRGETDGQITLGEVQALYRDLLGVRDKVLVHVACASHYLVWENQHEVLLRASEEWLRSGTFGGQSTGIFRADREGRVTSAP